MKVSEDRFPLLFVYLEDQEEQYDVRARSITRGAAEILGKWPQYLTFVTYMSVIGLLSLLVCFILSVFVLSLTAHEAHNPRKFSLVKCDSKEGIDHEFHLTNFDGVDANNATFIVDVHSTNDDRNAVACAVESYLIWTSFPVYHVSIISDNIRKNTTIFSELQKKFRNYRVVNFRADDFLRGTSFANSKIQNGNTLRFLSKVLIAWNFGGIILDSDLIALSNFRNLLSNEDDLVMGLIGPDIVLISAKRVCHSFMFNLMKYMTKEESMTTPAEIVKTVHKDFCNHGRNCSTVRVISEPHFCESDDDGCVFMKYKNAIKHGRDVWRRVCPLTKFFS